MGLSRLSTWNAPLTSPSGYRLTVSAAESLTSWTGLCRAARFTLLGLALFEALVLPAQDSPIVIGQDTYAKAMDRLSDEYTFHDYSFAMQDARVVLAFDPREFRAYYYMALIEFNQEHPESALRYAKSALPLAGGGHAQIVQHLIDSVNAMEESLRLRDLAVADQGSGLYAKAAAEFEQAYRISPSRWSLGAAAANLYVSLGDVPNAAFVLRSIATSADRDVSYVASEWLLDGKTRITETADGLVDRGNALVGGDLLWSADAAERESALQSYAEALKARPRCEATQVCPWILLDRVKAFNGDVEGVKNDLKTAAGNHLVMSPSTFVYFRYRDGRREEVYDGAWLPLLCDPPFAQFLRQVFGEDAARVADGTCHSVTTSPR